MKLLKFSIVFLFLSCGAKKSLNDKEQYIQEYKLQYYCSCLKYGFNNAAINNLLVQDSSGYGEPILGMEYVVIDSIAKVTAREIFQDSVKSAGKIPAERQGKKVFEKCLYEYNSNWLKESAKAAYKRSK